MKYRVEDKYIVNDAYIELLKLRLGEIMDLDEHSKNGSYLIRSLYFDDMKDSMLYEVEDGTDYRYKLRLRTYNRDESFINYEKKSKRNGFTHKESVRLDRETAEKMIEADDVFSAATVDIQISTDTHELIKQHVAEAGVRLLHPVTIVEYERMAYISPAGNVRITIDKNIGGCSEVKSFFDENIDTCPVLPAGSHILEIKYDEVLPAYIKDMINIGRLSRTSYSKYYMARRLPQIC